MGALPRCIDLEGAKETDQGVSHEGYAAALRGTVEEGNLDLVGFERFGVMKRCFPGCVRVDGRFVVFLDCELGASLAVDFDLVALR